MKDKYCFNIAEGGSKSLGILDYCFNKSTQPFLLKSGLYYGMKVLEIGCGSGKMSGFIAKQIGDNGQLIAIDNNQNQINTAHDFAINNPWTLTAQEDGSEKPSLILGKLYGIVISR